MFGSYKERAHQALMFGKVLKTETKRLASVSEEEELF